ncbi:MAG: LysM peptidoglycan-binding domain-containing protein [Chloroflexi bacterium]|nr:LysM peptidoglycan-binding domain-containing protein [Chloroflexota bacterium]
MTSKHRRIRFGLTIVPLLIGLAFASASGVSAESPLIHVVAWGDTLASIASRYGATINAVMQANSLSNPNFVWVGERLLIPSGGYGYGHAAGASSYSVQSGDTLFSIASRNGTTVSALMQANGLYNYTIYVGQRLKLPGFGQPQIAAAPYVQGKGKGQSKGVYHVVKNGDYLANIASTYGSSPYSIQIANNISNQSFLYVGEKLFIPDGIAPANLQVENPYPQPGAQQPGYVAPVYPSLSKSAFVYQPLPSIAPSAPPATWPYHNAIGPSYPTPVPYTQYGLPVSGSGNWQATLVESDAGGGSCSLGVFVDGETNWPVVVATTDGSWISDPKYTGSKPERGPYYVEFAHSCSGTWRVIPLGLNTYADVQMQNGHIEIEFRRTS